MKKLSVILVLLLAVMGLGLTASAQSQVEITFVHIFGVAEGAENEDVRIAVIQGIVDAFMAENDNVVIRVESSSTNYEELFNNALRSAEQGLAPHIVQVEEGLVQLAVDSGYFVPISDIATEEQLASLDDLLGPVREFYNLGEEVWGIPWNSSNPVFYYNRDMFRTAGLDPDVPPRTFAEVLTACEAIAAALPDLPSCANWPMVSWFPEQWVSMQGGLIVNNGNGREARPTEVYYDSPEMLNVVNFMQEMAQRGFYRYTGTPQDYVGEAGTFLTRRSAMTINSTAGISNFIAFSGRLGVDLGVARLPIPNEDATNGVTMGGAALFVTAGHSDAELQAAADFIFFLTNTENDMAWHMGSGYFPNRVTSLEQLTANGWFEQNPFYRVAIDQLNDSQRNAATAGAVIGPSATVRGYLIEAIQSVVDGGQDPLTALQAARTRAERELADYNSLFE